MALKFDAVQGWVSGSLYSPYASPINLAYSQLHFSMQMCNHVPWVEQLTDATVGSYYVFNVHMFDLRRYCSACTCRGMHSYGILIHAMCRLVARL